MCAGLSNVAFAQRCPSCGNMYFQGAADGQRTDNGHPSESLLPQPSATSAADSAAEHQSAMHLGEDQGARHASSADIDPQVPRSHAFSKRAFHVPSRHLNRIWLPRCRRATLPLPRLAILTLPYPDSARDPPLCRSC